MPVDIQQRPVRESSEIWARRPIFRVLCSSTNPTFAKLLPRVSRLREGSKPSCTPARPVMLSEVELSEGQSHAAEASLPASPKLWGRDLESPTEGDPPFE
jgi:hypothetical protein